MGLPEMIIKFLPTQLYYPSFCMRTIFAKRYAKKVVGAYLKELVQVGAKRITVVHRVFLLLFKSLLKDDFSAVIS